MLQLSHCPAKLTVPCMLKLRKHMITWTVFFSRRKMEDRHSNTVVASEEEDSSSDMA